MPKGEIVGIMIYLSLVTTLIKLRMLTELITQYSVYRAFSGYRAVQCIPSSSVLTEQMGRSAVFTEQMNRSAVFTEKMNRSAVFTE